MGGPRALYLISAEGGAPRRLTTTPEYLEEANWSRDGKWIYFSSDRSGQNEVWKMPSSGGAPVQVTTNGGRSPIESPDGKFLYYTKFDGSPYAIWKVLVGGGAESLVVKNLTYTFSFVVVEEGIYFIAGSGVPAPGVLYFFNFASRTLKPIATMKLAGLGISISPDQRSILYAPFDQSGSNLMLVENFH